MKEIGTTNVYNALIDVMRKNKTAIRYGGGALNSLNRLVFPKKNIIDRSSETHNNVLMPILNDVRQNLDNIKLLLLFTTETSVDIIDEYLTAVETLSKNVHEIEQVTVGYHKQTGHWYGPLYGPYLKYGTIFGNIDQSTGINNYKKVLSTRDAYKKDVVNFLTDKNSNARRIAKKILDTWDIVDNTNTITESLIGFLNSNDFKFVQFIINGYSTVI